VSRALAARFPDGVWFVPLATVTDPGLVGLAVVGALRLANPSGRAWIDVVADRLRDWAALLVLDSFEHVAEAGPFVAELLARAPGIAVLATSRVVLGLTGEHEYPVRPLPSGEAATLFAQRARAVRPHDWSYRLLAPDEQALLRRLSVFVGGCTWASAEAVSAGDDSPVDGLETLVEHSLVWYQETAGLVRHRMLATIREYAGERLEQAGERDRLRRRHPEWFAGRAHQAYRSATSGTPAA
jgi:predicted ATPase